MEVITDIFNHRDQDRTLKTKLYDSDDQDMLFLGYVIVETRGHRRVLSKECL